MEHKSLPFRVHTARQANTTFQNGDCSGQMEVPMKTGKTRKIGEKLEY